MKRKNVNFRLRKDLKTPVVKYKEPKDEIVKIFYFKTNSSNIYFNLKFIFNYLKKFDGNFEFDHQENKSRKEEGKEESRVYDEEDE